MGKQSLFKNLLLNKGHSTLHGLTAFVEKFSSPSCKMLHLFSYNRYGDARDIKRKIVFHAGPTNSGKTYHALERFCNAKSGVYCGPLKLLASEVHMKTNDKVNKQPSISQNSS